LVFYKLLELLELLSFAKLRFLELLGNMLKIGPNTGSLALARFRLGQLVEPVQSGIIDGFGYVEAEIESTVIAAAHDQHELSRFVLRFTNFKFGVFFL